MSAHLRCTRCGRQPLGPLTVTLDAEGVPRCDGADCTDMRIVRPGRRAGRGLALAAAAALMGAGGGVTLRPTCVDRARARRDRPNHGDPGAESRIAAAAEKRARRAAKRTPTPPEAP